MYMLVLTKFSETNKIKSTLTIILIFRSLSKCCETKTVSFRSSRGLFAV